MGADNHCLEDSEEVWIHLGDGVKCDDTANVYAVCGINFKKKTVLVNQRWIKANRVRKWYSDQDDIDCREYERVMLKSRDRRYP